MEFTRVNQLSLLSRAPKTGARYARVAAAIGTVALLSAPAMMQAQTQPSIGTMVLNNLTVPRGGLWLAESNGGGHYWVADQVLGICRVDPAAGTATGFAVSNCQAAAKSAGQPVVANPGAGISGLPANAKFVFVPDYSTKSVSVVRYVFDPSKGTLSGALTMAVQNATSVGGGAGGGRAVAAALAPNGVDLFVGYLKSGDIMKITGATTTTSGSPVVSKVASTSDGRGVNSLLMFNGDLYLAEIGGFGMSTISDIAGLHRLPCSANAPCTATPMSPQMSFFPGGLATDGSKIYIGDSPLTTPGSILQYDPVTLQTTTYAVNVPAYTSTFDGKTRNQYVNPFGVSVLPGGDLMIGDDPSASLVVATPPTIQGHLWRVKPPALPPSVTSISPNTGKLAGGDPVTVNGSGFNVTVGATQVFFGANQSPNVTCASTSTCTAVSPAGSGVVDVTVSTGGQTSAATPADQFTYTAAPPPDGTPVVTSVSPTRGLADGGTVVTIAGSNFNSQSTVTFGGINASNIQCVDAACSALTALSPAGVGQVDVQVTSGTLSSQLSAADKFTYIKPAASLFAWGITAPKGGLLFVPGALGGHFWSSDHANGFCRLDPMAGTTLMAVNYAVCDDGSVGSPGQAVYDPRVNADGSHYIYVPDNAVKSTAVWRLTFNPATETIVGAPEAMIPLADVRTLKPNGMALGPDGNLYVTDLTEPNIRKITTPAGDPRGQTVSIVAVTGDGRGANGTVGFIGNKLFISENRAASWIDITVCTGAGTPCATNPIPLPSGAFVAGVATDPVNGFVYASDSPGGANAGIWRYNMATNTTSLYVQGGTLPASGAPEATVRCALTCTRPWDPARTLGGTAGFSFAFGIWVDQSDGSLYITEDPTAGARSARGTAWKVPLVK